MLHTYIFTTGASAADAQYTVHKDTLALFGSLSNVQLFPPTELSSPSLVKLTKLHGAPNMNKISLRVQSTTVIKMDRTPAYTTLPPSGEK